MKFLPVFSAPGYLFGEWVVNDGQFPWYKTGDEVDEFVKAVYANGWIMPFDWAKWRKDNPDAEALETIGGADVEHLQKLLTSIVRGNRFCEGVLAKAFESGTIIAILRRLGEIVQSEFD